MARSMDVLAKCSRRKSHLVVGEVQPAGNVRIVGSQPYNILCAEGYIIDEDDLAGLPRRLSCPPLPAAPEAAAPHRQNAASEQANARCEARLQRDDMATGKNSFVLQ